MSTKYIALISQSRRTVVSRLSSVRSINIKNVSIEARSLTCRGDFISRTLEVPIDL